MYRLREIDSADQQRCDAFVAASGGHVCQSYAWGEAERARGWRPLRLLMEDDAGQVVASAAALTKSIAGRWSVMDIPWGPVFDPDSPGIGVEIVRALKQYARDHHVVDLRLNPEMPPRAEILQLLASEGLTAAATAWRYQATWRIDLGSDVDRMLARMEQATRNKIRRAEKSGCTITTPDTPDQLEAFLALYRETCERRDHTGRSEAELRAIWSLPDVCRLFIGWHEGRPYHALMIYAFGSRVWQAYSASSFEIRMPGQLVNWAAIKWAKENGFRSYDFGGRPRSPETDPAHQGIYRYKRGFGGEEVDLLGELEWSPGPLLGWAFRRGSELRSAVKGLAR